MEQSDARFEFRCWASSFGVIDTRLRRLSACHGIRESEEIYIVSAAIDDTNIKVRDGALDIKELIERHDDLERWRPAGKYQFPLTSSTIEREVLPRLDIAKLGGSRDTYAVEPLIEEIVLPHGEWVVARVFKRRFAFTVVGCAAELDEVWINGAGLHSVAIESTNPSAVVDVRYRVGVDDLENVNYLQAIKRVTGMVPLRTPY